MSAGILSVGGGGLLTIHRIVVTGSAYAVKAANGTTAATLAAEATLLAKLYLSQTAITAAAEGGKIAATNYDMRTAVFDGLKVLAPLTGSAAAGTGPAAVQMETGISYGGPGSSASGVLGLWIYYGPLDNTDVPGDAVNRRLYWGVGNVDLSSHNVTFSGGNYTSNVITINPVAPAYSISTVATLVDATYVTPTALTLAQYQTMNYADFLKP